MGAGSWSRLKAHQPRSGSRFCSWPLWSAEPHGSSWFWVSRCLTGRSGLDSLHAWSDLGLLHVLQAGRVWGRSCSADRSGLGSLRTLRVGLVSRSVAGIRYSQLPGHLDSLSSGGLEAGLFNAFPLMALVRSMPHRQAVRPWVVRREV